MAGIDRVVGVACGFYNTLLDDKHVRLYAQDTSVLDRVRAAVRRRRGRLLRRAVHAERSPRIRTLRLRENEMHDLPAAPTVMTEAEREKNVAWWLYESGLSVDEILEIAELSARNE